MEIIRQQLPTCLDRPLNHLPIVKRFKARAEGTIKKWAKHIRSWIHIIDLSGLPVYIKS